MSDRIHLAPSAWVTFEAAGVVVLSFLPQIAVSDLNAEELPSYHRNIDMDEVILAHVDDDPKGSLLRRLLVYAARRFARRRRGLPRRISDPAHTGDAADAHRHRRRHLSAAERNARVRANDGVIPRPFPSVGDRRLLLPRRRDRDIPEHSGACRSLRLAQPLMCNGVLFERDLVSWVNRALRR